MEAENNESVCERYGMGPCVNSVVKCGVSEKKYFEVLWSY